MGAERRGGGAPLPLVVLVPGGGSAGGVFVRLSVTEEQGGERGEALAVGAGLQPLPVRILVEARQGRGRERLVVVLPCVFAHLRTGAQRHVGGRAHGLPAPAAAAAAVAAAGAGTGTARVVLVLVLLLVLLVLVLLLP